MGYQIAPPGDHRESPAENSIKHAKARFISALACTDRSFGRKDWDLLLPHCELTLSLLRPPKLNPMISAHTLINGHHGFRSNPIAPAGAKAIAHERKLERGTWGGKGADGFYTHTAPKHYRCCHCLIPKANDFRISNTVEFFPEPCKAPRGEAELGATAT